MRVITSAIAALVTLGIVAGGPSARADIMVWDLVADCPTAGKEVRLKMSYSVEDPQSPGTYNKDRREEAKTVYACGGTCGEAKALATPINWAYKDTSCTCYPSGKKETCDPTDSYRKCAATYEASLPYDCGALAYQKICVSPTCKDDGLTAMMEDSAPCAELAPLTQASQCLPADSIDTVPSEAESGGCSFSSRTASASLLSMLALVAGLSLLRRRHGR